MSRRVYYRNVRGPRQRLSALAYETQRAAQLLADQRELAQPESAAVRAAKMAARKKLDAYNAAREAAELAKTEADLAIARWEQRIAQMNAQQHITHTVIKRRRRAALFRKNQRLGIPNYQTMAYIRRHHDEYY